MLAFFFCFHFLRTFNIVTWFYILIFILYISVPISTLFCMNLNNYRLLLHWYIPSQYIQKFGLMLCMHVQKFTGRCFWHTNRCYEEHFKIHDFFVVLIRRIQNILLGVIIIQTRSIFFTVRYKTSRTRFLGTFQFWCNSRLNYLNDVIIVDDVRNIYFVT